MVKYIGEGKFGKENRLKENIKNYNLEELKLKLETLRRKEV